MNDLNQYGCDAILISSKENKYYFCDLYSGSGYCLWINNEFILFVDGRYFKEMKNKSNSEVYLLDNENTITKYLNDFIDRYSIQTIGLEADKLSYTEYVVLSDSIKCKCNTVNIDKMRMTKSNDEIKIMKEAAKIATDSLKAILPKIKIGESEKEIANYLVSEMKSRGAQKEAFDLIVASGMNGAYPHAKASDKIIKNNEMITIDFGARFKEYCSDCTRTFAIGSPNKKLIEMYECVKKAQESAIQAIRPGVRCKDIDKIARDVIIQAGYKDYFTHNLGHGLGIECHESPRLSPTDETILSVGMVVTVEPGIYIEGVGGVRIEDDILVTVDGYEIITKFSKDLIYLKG